MNKEQVLKLIEDFIGDKEKAREWIEKPCCGLGGKTPLEITETQEGIDRLERVILQIEHGVF